MNAIVAYLKSIRSGQWAYTESRNHWRRSSKLTRWLYHRPGYFETAFAGAKRRGVCSQSNAIMISDCFQVQATPNW